MICAIQYARKESQPRQELERERPYLKVSRYDSDHSSLQAYSKAQAIVFRSDADLSAYRLRYQDVPHVVVLGTTPIAEIEARLSEALSAGHAAELPADIVAYLTQRRAQAKRIGPWVERHYGPGNPT